MLQTARACQTLPESLAEGTGLEHTAYSSENPGVAPQGGAKSGALSGDSAPIDPDLAAVVAAWPTLPKATRRRVVEIVGYSIDLAPNPWGSGTLAPHEWFYSTREAAEAEGK